ncbi:unnamed protein product [Mytilus edulis]|uniref:Uncharacterized protein n=1 Tax=Mytilus edulis TaxID=6550 RepID=A0A8S3RI48_MYTED|nr:unnamed protein product [Mytilus edulis]
METTALPPLNRHRAKKRRSTRTQPQRADLPDNTIINSSNNNLPNSPSANDIAEALFAKLHSSGIHLVKDNNVMPTSEISAILNPSLQTGHASSTQSMQIPFITSIPPLTTIPNDNSDDHDSSLALFQPPLSSDPDVIPGEQFHSSSANVDTPYACHMLKHSIPIYFHVSCKLKDDVWADNYVNFAFLLPSNIEEDSSTLFENFNITISNRKNKRELQSIHQWMNAFDIFMSIYLGKSLNSALALVKYGYTIRGLCKSLGFQAAKTYDEKFRRVRKILNLRWDTINDELWRSVSLTERSNSVTSQDRSSFMNTSKNTFPRRVQQQFQFPIGYCWAFCKSGECT